MTEPVHKAVAEEMFALLGTGGSTEPVTARDANFDLDAAYRVTSAVRALREARGERVVGRKVGFTNTSIWDRYDVHAPIWGFAYDTTLRDLATIKGPLHVAAFSEPRIEPEIIFGFKAAPQPDMTPRQIIATVDWVSQGFEIVSRSIQDGSSRPPTPSRRSACMPPCWWARGTR